MPSIIPKITINGKESTEISGLIIVSLPPITKPAMRAVAEEIDGRDGDQIEKLGFSAYDKTIRIALSGNYDVDDVIEYFNQDGIITFSNEPDKYYRFKQLEGIDFEKLMRYKTADVVFHCQPFKFSITEEELTFFEPHSVSITNAGNIYSKPEIALTGHGNMEMGINGSPVLAVDFGDEQQTIIIDTEKMNAYGTKSNIKSLVAEIVCDGGNGSPDSPIPIVGHSELNLTRCGKNLIDNILTTQDYHGIRFTVNADKSITANGTADTSFVLGITATTTLREKGIISGKNYFLSGCPAGGSANTYRLQFSLIGSGSEPKDYGNGVVCNFNESDIDKQYRIIIYVNNGVQLNNLTFYPMLVVGNTATAYEPYNGTTFTVAFGQTVYGGQLDVTRGKLTITRKYSKLKDLNWTLNGTFPNTFNGTGLSDRKTNVLFANAGKCNIYEARTSSDVADYNYGIAYGMGVDNTIIYVKDIRCSTISDFIMAITTENAEICYELATPIVIQLTAQEIMALIGENHIFTNTGAIESCVYMKDGAEIEASGEIITFIADVGDIISNAFKNRLVIGNYDNVKLEKGINTITFNPIEEGSEIDEMAISKYSRWL